MGGVCDQKWASQSSHTVVICPVLFLSAKQAASALLAGGPSGDTLLRDQMITVSSPLPVRRGEERTTHKARREMPCMFVQQGLAEPLGEEDGGKRAPAVREKPAGSEPAVARCSGRQTPQTRPGFLSAPFREPKVRDQGPAGWVLASALSALLAHGRLRAHRKGRLSPRIASLLYKDTEPSE